MARYILLVHRYMRSVKQGCGDELAGGLGFRKPVKLMEGA